LKSASYYWNNKETKLFDVQKEKQLYRITGLVRSNRLIYTKKEYEAACKIKKAYIKYKLGTRRAMMTKLLPHSANDESTTSMTIESGEDE